MGEEKKNVKNIIIEMALFTAGYKTDPSDEFEKQGNKFLCTRGCDSCRKYQICSISVDLRKVSS